MKNFFKLLFLGITVLTAFACSNSYDLSNKGNLVGAANDKEYLKQLQSVSRAVPGSAPNPEMGDVNADGVVDNIDAIMTARYAMGMSDPGFNPALADVNGESKTSAIDQEDALTINNYVNSVITQFPNQIKNGLFTNSTDSKPDYWESWNQFSENEVNISVVGSELKVIIDGNSTGNQLYSVNLTQVAVKLEKGAEYVVSFKARAETAQKIGCVAERRGGTDGTDWTQYSNEYTDMVAPVLKEYTFKFKMEHDTDLSAGLQFRFGGSHVDNTIYVDDVSLRKVIRANEMSINLPDNLLRNSSLDNNMDWWYQWTCDGGAGSAIIDNGAAMFTIDNHGEQKWSLGFGQSGFKLEKGREYVIRFDVWADKESEMFLKLQSNDQNPPEHNHLTYYDYTVPLTKYLKTYEVVFTMTGETDPEAEFQFHFGKDAENPASPTVARNVVHIDNVSIRKKNLIKNGDFTQNSDNWNIYENNNSTAQLEAADGHLQINVNSQNNPRDDWAKIYDIALRQDGFSLEAGCAYVLSFDAKASNSFMRIAIKLQMFHEPWESLFTKDKISVLTDKWNSYKYIVYVKENDPQVSLVFFLGSFAGEGTVFLDNVRIEKQSDLQINSYIDPNYIYTYEKTKFVPADGKKLLIIGQEIPSIAGYNNSFDNAAGYTMYIDPNFDPNEQSDIGIAYDPDNNSYLDWVYNNYGNENYVMNIGLSLRGPEAGDNMLDNEMCIKIVAGDYDTRLDLLIDWVKKANIPVYLRIGYEFDGNHNYLEPGEYIAAYKYIVDRIRNSGAANVAFVWHSVTNTSWSDIDFEDYYPGSDYVDWFGVSFFNEQLTDRVDLDKFVDLAKSHRKPVMICEAAPIMHGITDSGIDADTLKTWYEWYIPVFNYMNEKNIKGFSYINCKWDDIPWTQDFTYSLGNTQVQDFPLVKEKWLEEISKEKYLKQGSDLFNEINFTR